MRHSFDQWGLYLWNPENGDNYIHSEDIAWVRLLQPNGRVFKRNGAFDEWVTFYYGTSGFRAKIDPYQPIPSPKFDIGDKVRPKNHPEQTAFVRDMYWHNKDERVTYFLEIAEKKKSKRYWDEDLILAY